MLSFGSLFIWEQTFLSDYTIQAIAVLVLSYIAITIYRQRKHIDMLKTDGTADIFILSGVVMLLISITGMEIPNRPDPSKLWSEIKEDFLLGLFKIIKRDVASYQVEDHHILNIIRKRHWHQREKYLEHQDKEKNKRARMRMRVNQRMVSVSIFININIFDYITIDNI